MLYDPNRGLLVPPNLDDRTWSDLVSDVVALIPQYAPQWTNQSPSDVGITLVELFAWLVEGLTYRLNQVPNKNYVAFLNMLGIERLPPDPARAVSELCRDAGAVIVAPGHARPRPPRPRRRHRLSSKPTRTSRSCRSTWNRRC